jgi:8-oxo-dGTP pyrophosphatase MutT (NUDIX family)
LLADRSIGQFAEVRGYTSRMPSKPVRLSAGVVVVRATAEGWRYLLLRAFTHWDFPKGMVEAGEEPLDAAIREVREESLIEDLQFRWGHEFTETGPYSRGKVARYYVAETQTSAITLPIIEELGRPEHMEFRWVDEQAALKLVSARVVPIIEWAAAKIAAAAR